tara:strand:+ start:82 stop:648 length:567 start_codon:yes stop_codon:yes gene_type:complete
MALLPTEPGEVRPQSFDLSHLFSGFTTTGGEEVESVNPAKMGRFLQLIMNIESYGGKNISQDTGGPGEGLFQLEAGEGQGGWTRLNRAVLNLPKNLTPEKLYNEWSAAGYKTVQTGKTGDFEATRLNEQEQIYLMAANIMMTEGGREAFDQWVYSGSEDDFLDWWAEYHWGGPEDERKTKREEARKNL